MSLPFLLLGLVLLLLVLGALRWYAAAPTPHVMAGLRWAAVIGGGAVALFLVMTGRAFQLVYLVIPVLPLLPKWWRKLRAASGSRSATSDVETPWLRMSLDHQAATMDGLVLQGEFVGRRLSELDAGELLDLLAGLRIAHPDSAALLEAYLDAVHAGWRERAGRADRPAPDARDEMSREEAWQILGLQPGASDEEVQRAWREAMKRNHPDHGGSPYLAAKINRAKARLLGA